MEFNFIELNARYLNVLTDFGFHKIFGEEEGKALLIHFLNLVIREESPIKDIKYLIPEQWGNYEKERKAVFDIYCETEKEESFIVEMQKAKQEYFRDRSLFYSAVSIRKQAKKGKWNYRLKRVYVAAILDFVIFEECKEDEKYVVEHVQLKRERTNTSFSNKLKFTFVELPKFGKTEEELETDFDRWLYLLKNLPKLQERPKTIKGEIFDKLFELAEINRLKEEEMETYKKSVLEYYDVQSAMKCARKEGIEEGIEKGIEEEKISIIQKCLQKNMPIEDIVFITGFSHEQINRYKTILRNS